MIREHDRQCLKLNQIILAKWRKFQDENEKFIESNFFDERKMEEFMLIIKTTERANIKNPDELKFYDGFHELQELFNEYERYGELFDQEFDRKIRELRMPSWVERHPVLKAHWVEQWNEKIVPMFDISKSIFQPRTEGDSMPDLFDSKIDKQLMEDLDPKAKITFDEEGIAKKLKDFNVHEKDEEKVRKASIMGEILNKLADDVAENPGLLDFKESVLRDPQLQESKEEETVKLTDGRIFTEEIPYVLFLNNSDPKKYNADFFAEYFKMDRGDFLKIVQRVSYPMINEQKGIAERVLRYVNI